MAENPLGGGTPYPDKYDPGILYPIPRWPARSLLDIDKKILMYGIDHWHGNVSGGGECRMMNEECRMTEEYTRASAPNVNTT